MRRVRALTAHLTHSAVAPSSSSSSSTSSASSSCKPCSYDVVIVGGSTAGASAAFQLATKGARVLVLEAGQPGAGTLERSRVPADAKLENPADQHHYLHGVAGSVVPFHPTASDGTGMAVKMMLGSPLAGPAADWVGVHGEDGLQKAFRLSLQGLELQKKLAAQFLPMPATQIRHRGSVYLATAEQEEELRKEYGVLKAYGFPVTLLELKEVNELYGAGGGFVAGLGYPQDAIINSQAYSAALLRAAEATGRCEVRLGARVLSIFDQSSPEASSPALDVPATARALVTPRYPCVTSIHTGQSFVSAHVVVAAGGMLMNTPLDRLPISRYVKPCWSYIINVDGKTDTAVRPAPPTPADSPNLLTFCQTKDWAICRGVLRLSGEDCNSARVQPQTKVRMEKLATWAYNRFAEGGFTTSGYTIPRGKDYTSCYGIYTETKDGMPFVGPMVAGQRINYLIGCNARGQCTFTFGASVLPGMLGYGEPLTKDESVLAAFLSPSRATAKTYTDAEQNALYGQYASIHH